MMYDVYGLQCPPKKKNVKGSFAVKVSSVHGERFQELHGKMRTERP